MRFSPEEAAPTPGRTDLPEFNLLVQAVEGLADATSTVEGALVALAVTERLLGAMQDAFLDVLALREHTPLALEVADSLDDHFAAIRTGMPALAQHIEAGHEAEMLAELARMADAVQGVCQGLRRLWEDEQKQEQACEIPAADEIVRVGRAYLRGRMPHASLRFALSRFEGYHRALLAGLETLQPSPREQSQFDAVQPSLVAALERQEGGIAELQAFLDDDDESRVAPALDEILAASRVLAEVQRGLVDAHDREPQISCPRCGHMNGSGERVCGTCHARLPWVPPGELANESRVDLMESGAGVAQTGTVQYEHLVRLEEMTRAVQRGDESLDALAALLRAQDVRTRETETRLARMQDPSPNTPPDQREIYESARQSLLAGIARMREGVAQMLGALEASRVDQLEEGLQSCLRAADELSVLQTLGSEMAAAQTQG